MPYEPTTNFRDSDDVDLGKKLVTKDYLLSVYETILESSPASGLIVTPELWVWGNSNRGQLGINDTTGSIQSPHFPEELTGNNFLVGKIIQQQSKLMGLYGFGVIILRDNLEII